MATSFVLDLSILKHCDETKQEMLRVSIRQEILSVNIFNSVKEGKIAESGS
jgi:hypothetical protein